MVTVQLPVYNERYVVERLIDSVCRLDYPRETVLKFRCWMIPPMTPAPLSACQS